MRLVRPLTAEFVGTLGLVFAGTAVVITDTGLVHFKEMKNLKELRISTFPKLSAPAMKELRAALPGCKLNQ